VKRRSSLYHDLPNLYLSGTGRMNVLKLHPQTYRSS
jgi:hypothetical protein